MVQKHQYIDVIAKNVNTDQNAEAAV